MLLSMRPQRFRYGKKKIFIVQILMAPEMFWIFPKFAILKELFLFLQLPYMAFLKNIQLKSKIRVWELEHTVNQRLLRKICVLRLLKKDNTLQLSDQKHLSGQDDWEYLKFYLIGSTMAKEFL